MSATNDQLMNRCFGENSSLSRCPEQSWLSLFPHLYFICLIPIQFLAFRIPKRTPAALPLRLRIRLLILIGLIITTLIELVCLYLGDGPPLFWKQVDNLGAIATWTLALVSLVIAFYTGRRSNGFVITYSLFQLIAQGLIFLKMIFDGQNVSIYAIVQLVLLFLLNGSFFGNDVMVVEKEDLKEQELNSFKTRVQQFSPMDTAGFHSRTTISWLSSLIALGYRKSLVLEDLFDLPRNTTSKYLMEKWESGWIRECRRVEPKATRPRIGRVLFRIFRSSMLPAMSLRLIAEALLFVNPLLLKYLIDFVSTPSAPLSFGLLCALCMFINSLLRSFLNNNYAYIILQNSVWMQSMLSNAIFRKILRLSPVSRGRHTVGEMMNFLAVDAEKIMAYLPFLVETITCPMDIVISMIMLWAIMGPTAISGIVLMVCIVPFNYYTSKYIKVLQKKQLKVKDERTKMSNEVLNGIKLIKLYAWEEAFEKEIDQLRAEEVQILRKMNMTARLVDALNSMAAPYLVAIVTFAFYVLSSEDNVLTPQVAFVALAVFNQLRMPMRILAMLINYLVQALVSSRRVEEFLIEDEIQQGQITMPKDPEIAVKAEKATFNWNGINSPASLTIPELSIRKGEFIAVVGAVGAGKSSLLNALLGEMCQLGGGIALSDRVAYVPQQPWLRNETLRQNITFGRPYDRRLFRRVTDAAQLRPDFDALDHGDMTEIGENGVTLSGGQKARIGLARALYQESEVYLLDDCLSAVDAHVGAAMYFRALGKEGILRGKTRILVTHGLQYTKECDRIVVMREGTIAEIGTYDELLKSGGLFAEMLQEREKTKKENEEEDEEMKFETARQLSSRLSRYDSTSESIKDEAKLVQKENVETGRVSNHVYMTYLRAVSLLCTLLITSFVVVHIIFAIARSLWLSDWSNGNQERKQTQEETIKKLSVFSALGLAEVITLLGIQAALVIGAQRASLRLHSPLLHAILRSPMAFFDTTPVGRILNRLSRDLEVIDNLLPSTIGMFLNCFVQLIVVLVMISIATPIFIIAIVPIALIYFFFLRYFINTARQLKRLESIRRSPILSLFGETVHGASSIRAYSKTQKICENFGETVDTFARCKHLSFAGNRWLGFRLETISACTILLAALCGVFSSRFSTISPAMIGMSISYALTITEMLYFGVRMMSELETYIVSVERVDEYSQLESEAEWRKEDGKLSKDWPQRGQITWEGYSTRYRAELPLVIRDLSLSTVDGEKVGVVGRTGSGKSSLTMALYRMIEPADGRILIDGVDIAQIGLHDLRERLSIIPQEPVLFSGTVRFNLDPFNKYTDSELWNALDICQLKDYVSTLDGQLSNKITEGGMNMSVGQRQLVCLGRALLRGGKILILDEATAACDIQTDALVQKAVREHFPSSSVIAIAHRLDTIADYDRILVLEKGHLKEFDKPKTLLETPGSLYAALVEKANRVHQ
ncbi:unnamed protein product, partial [Mesorhabditis belari]|uniref:ABC-type glutathione-S-conjugate transporter n=1 Tax=Mesorhabditis belari TaxID=2138241 RepID=A0AAF3FD64_9BILA